MRKSKRVVIVSDLHCGHVSGLTPPGHMSGDKRHHTFQDQAWKAYTKMLKELQPIDILVANGDLIDGKEHKTSGELLTNSITAQVRLATECLKEADAKKILVTRGTWFHVTPDDAEDILRDNDLKATVKDQIWLDVNGVCFHIRHFVHGSQLPHGRFTAVSRERLQNLLWSEIGIAHKADVIIRSHVHYHVFCGTHEYLAMTTPSLQGWTKYGSRKMSSTVDWGMVHFDVNEKGEYSWEPHIVRLSTLKEKKIYG